MTQPRAEIQQALSRLRRWIRRYVFLEGLAATIALACLLFWLTFGIDVAYFHLSRLELPRWFRLASLVGMGMLLAGTVFSWVLLRLLRRLRPADLALTLERRFPELNDRLITSVELAHRPASLLQGSMLDRTSAEAVARLSSLPVEEAFNPVPLRRMAVIAWTLLVSVLMIGLADAQGMERWYNAYILGRDNYWEPFRRNALRIHVVAQPGDRVREFDERHVYRHPRGADLQLVAVVPTEARPPERVDMQFLSFGGVGTQRGTVTMSRMGDLEFRHTLGRVVNDQELWFRGGDYVNREPFRVQVVDPPRVDSIQLQCDYPSYTGLDELEDRPVPVVGTQVSLPMETRFELSARANKPLLAVHVRCRRFELSFGYEPLGSQRRPLSTRLMITDPKTDQMRVITGSVFPDTLFDRERMQFHVPLVVGASAGNKLDGLQELTMPLPLPPDEQLQMFLEDEDGILSPEPATLIVQGIVDQSPVVDTRRTGIGTAVTRMANIPIEGRLTDDYGVASGWIGYRIDQQTDEQRQDLANPPAGQKEFTLKQSADRNVELFNLIPLHLEDGQSLTLAVYAADGDNLNGPHVSHGEPFTFKIVPPEELLAKLFDREVNLRLRFEQIRSEVADFSSTLLETKKQVRDLEAGSQSGPSKAVVAAYVDRGLHQIRKNHTESRSIEVSFRDLRDEMVNNRVETVELFERVERRVIEPMSLLNSAAFLDVDRRLGVLRLAVERGAGMESALGDVSQAADILIAQMDAILAEMQDRGTYNDLIQNLQQIIDRQKQVQERTDNKRIEENFLAPRQ